MTLNGQQYYARVALSSSPEAVPSGWKGPVAPVTQSCFYLNENGAATGGNWGTAGGQSNTPSGRVIYFSGASGASKLTTTGYAGQFVRLFSPGGGGASPLRLRVTHQASGALLYDQIAALSQNGDKSYLVHEVALPFFAAWHLELWQGAGGGGISLTDPTWT